MILKAKVPLNATHKPRPVEKWRTKAYFFVTSQFFEFGIIIVIIVNMIQMAIAFEGSGKAVEVFLDLTNYIFTVIFMIEASFKIFVFGWAYFNTNWNRFDFFVVISSILDIGLQNYEEQAQEESGFELK